MAEERRSPGGDVVDKSLEAVGYRHSPQRVALVETSWPRRSAYEVVLSQNAWNFIGASDFRGLARAYSVRSRRRYLARRVVARLNVRRAGRALVLSRSMGDLLEQRGLTPEVVPVTLPLDLCMDLPPRRPAWIRDGKPFLLVPGTLTWYKNAEYLLPLMGRLPPDDRPLLVLAGTDDGSGCQQWLSSRLTESGIPFVAAPVARAEMLWLLRHAHATIIPSRLESLSFSLGEALTLSQRVLASPLPVHQEVSERLGRVPFWLPATTTSAVVDHILSGVNDVAISGQLRSFATEWERLRDAIGMSVPSATDD